MRGKDVLMHFTTRVIDRGMERSMANENMLPPVF